MDPQSIQTAVYRLSARLSENLSETARDLGLQGLDAGSLAAGAGGAAGKYLEDGAVITDEGIRETKKLLETRRDASMAEGLRRVLAMMLKGRPVLTFFPQVVQCLSSSSSSNSSSPTAIQIRSLVSLYIHRQARLEPDLALLPVNMYQKDLRDPNPVIRALALRTLSGMGLESIAALVLMSLKTASRDTNWFVRRTVAESLDKVFALDPSHITSLLPILQTLLADRNALVLGTAVSALEAICPDRLELLHQQYRRICKSLVDTDEWSQIVMLRVLERYARVHFADPSKAGKLDADLQFLLKGAEPLFYNRNAAVVISVVRVYHRLAPASYAAKYVQPLLRLLQAEPEQQAIVLSNMAAIAADRPNLFAPHAQRFYIHQAIDIPAVRSLKLQVLILLVNKDNIRTILPELMVYIRSPDTHFVSEVVRSIGRCGLQLASVREECAKFLLRLIMQGDSEEVVQQALSELHKLLTAGSQDTTKTASIFPASKILLGMTVAFFQGRIASPASRANFYQLLAESLHLLSGNMVSAVDALRIGLKRFSKETEHGKSALLLLSAKLVLLSSASPPPFIAQLHQLHAYASTMARYDASWAIRDLNRFFSALLAQAGVKVADETTAAIEEKEAEEAFHRGDKVSESANGVDEVSTAMQAQRDAQSKDHLQQKLKHVLSARSNSSSTDAGTSIGSVGLARWPSLPAWATETTSSKLRDPPVDEESTPQGAATSYGSGPRPSKASSSSRTAARVQTSGSRSKREKVVLVPTESDPSYYAKPEQPRSKGLQEFLDSDDDEESELPQPALRAEEAEDTEESSSEEEESEEESEEGSSDESDNAGNDAIEASGRAEGRTLLSSA